MFTKVVVVSSLAATALAAAAPAPEPVITAAPALRRGVGDALGGLGSDIDNIIGDASSAIGNLGDNAGDLISKGIGGASDILGDIGTNLGDIGTNLGEFGTCISAGLALATEIPKPPQEVAEAIASAVVTAKPSDNCFGTLVPSSIQSDYSAYESSLASWYAQNSDKVSSVLSVCPTLPAEYSESISSLTPCNTALAAAASGSGSGSGGSGSGGDSAATTYRVTGAVAAIVGGAIGAAAFLL